MDYGCGKLRYSIPLANRVETVVGIDSKFQWGKKQIINRVKGVLKEKGYIFITVQYRNSYFSKYVLRADLIRYHDGWLLPRNNCKCSFFGLVTVEKITDLCSNVGLDIFGIKRYDGSLFIKAKKDENG